VSALIRAIAVWQSEVPNKGIQDRSDLGEMLLIGLTIHQPHPTNNVR